MTKEHGILFSLQMILAKRKGIKDVTRRIPNCKNSLVEGKFVKGKKWTEYDFDFSVGKIEGNNMLIFSRYEKRLIALSPVYRPGELLFTRENWQIIGWDFEDGECRFKYADGVELTLEWPSDAIHETAEWLDAKIWEWVNAGLFEPLENEGDEDEVSFKRTDKKLPFSPSIHLPKWGSRIWDELISIRPERIQDITDDDATREGIEILEDSHCVNDLTPKGKFNVLWNDMHPGSWAQNDFVWRIEFKNLDMEGNPRFKAIVFQDA